MYDMVVSFCQFCRAHTLKVIGLTFFCMSMLLTAIGIWIHVLWMRHATVKKEREKEMAIVARAQLFPKETTLVNGEASAEEGMACRPGMPLLIKDHPPPAQISQIQKVCIIIMFQVGFICNL